VDATVTYVRVFADDAGRSRMEERTLALDRELSAPPAEPLKIASLVTVFGSPADVMLVTGEAAWAGAEPHPAPGRLLWAILAGEWRVTVDEGVSRTFSAGDLVLFEDTSGNGHSSRILSDGARAVVLRFP
jgi:hypothetical protein